MTATGDESLPSDLLDLTVLGGAGMHRLFLVPFSAYSQLSPSFPCIPVLPASAQHQLCVAASLHLGTLQTSYIGSAGESAPTATSAAAGSVQTDAVAATAVDSDHGGEDYAGGLCIVCFDARRSVILAPCGHVAMCR